MDYIHQVFAMLDKKIILPANYQREDIIVVVKRPKNLNNSESTLLMELLFISKTCLMVRLVCFDGRLLISRYGLRQYSSTNGHIPYLLNTLLS